MDLKTSPEKKKVKADIEPSSLKPESNQIQKVHKLAEHQTLRGGIFASEITQFLYQRLNLWRGAPVIKVESTKNTLSNVWSNFSHFQRCRFQINRQWEVANWARRLDKAKKGNVERTGDEIRTFSSGLLSRYCLIHSRSKICRHLDWIASSAMSLQMRQTVASSTSSGINFVELVLLRRTRSGWHAICLIRVSL